MPKGSHPDLEVVKFTVEVGDSEETIDVQVEGVEDVIFNIPESSKFVTTIYFRVKNRELKDVKYKQVIKKAGVPIKTRDLELGPVFQPSDEIYSTAFPEDTTPGGFFFRGTYPATSTYYADGEELFTSDWTLTITSKA
ncbi:immunoglobulin E-set [Scheffersomyces amazonensis]|uniref:immunoglobulin E-set n=1 Tax=Scheffersomyces amazonensis TaxID=1078765 RepID=UPI00315CE204